MQSISHDMFPPFQLFLLILTSLLFHIGATNPNQSSVGDYRPYDGVGSAFTVFFGPKFGKLIIWISTLYQVLYLYLEAYAPATIPSVFPQISRFIDPLPFTSIAVFGYILIIVGGVGRIWCYKTLGVFFTYEITIRSSHKLIKNGPYAYVRHPSYTFVYLLAIGTLFVHQRLANFFPNTGWLQILLGPVGLSIICIIVALLLVRRVTYEEEALSNTFANEWTEYVSKTKRFLPGII